MTRLLSRALLAITLLGTVSATSAGGFADLFKQKLDAAIDEVAGDVSNSVQQALRDRFPALTEMTGIEPVPKDYGDKVTVFQFRGCPYCRKLTAFLDDRGIDYVNMDVERNRAAKQEFKRLGGRGVPLTIVGTESVGGFNATTMTEFLTSQGIIGS